MEAGLPHKYCVRNEENIINISDYVAYDATSGVITSKQSLGNRKASSLMGTVDKAGYLTFVLRGKRYNNAVDAYTERCNLAEKPHGEYYHP